MKYRNLKVGETIHKGDEFSRGHFNPKWFSCENNIGEKYDPNKHWEVRRVDEDVSL